MEEGQGGGGESGRGGKPAERCEVPMHADGELSPWQRMPEETAVDMTRRHTVLQEGWEAVWERSRAGRHTIVLGSHTLPPAPPDLQVLRVRCDTLGTSEGALDAARRAIADHLGEEL